MTKDRVSLVFEREGSSEPDFLWRTESGSEAMTILVHSGRTMRGNLVLPTKTEIYDWDGKAYNLLATAPYDQRYDALTRLAHEARD